MHSRPFLIVSVLFGITLLEASQWGSSSSALAQDKTSSTSTVGTLKSYIATPDASFLWERKDGGEYEGCKWARIHMVSQVWKETTWRHVFWIIVPNESNNTNPSSNKHALIHITGGGWNEKWPSSGPETLTPPEDAKRMAMLAKATGSPVCMIQHVPFQPMFGGMVEDEIISKTFVEFIKTGDGTWPLLFPMVKAVVRGMDTCDEYMQKNHQTKIEKFTLFGGSKRGWTTWLSSAIDPRVDALAPAVIDVLNMEVQMKHQLATWGQYSEQIADYSSKGLPDLIGAPRGKKLLELVDPYEYRGQIQQPKLLIFGTNDRYWPVDACKNYWSELVGDKYLLYVPNQGHGIKDMERVLGSISALHRSRTGGEALPKMKWGFEQKSDKVGLSIDCEPKPMHVRCWVARSKTKDFRDAKWTDTPMNASGESYLHATQRDKDYLAVFGEVVVDHEPFDAYFSTNLQVFEPTP